MVVPKNDHRERFCLFMTVIHKFIPNNAGRCEYQRIRFVAARVRKADSSVFPDCKFMNINDFKENRGGVGIMHQIT